MKTKIFLLVFLMLFLQSAVAESKATIPLSINNVEVLRVHGNLVRVIQHNMELLPQLEIEVIAVPELVLLKRLVITQVTTANEVIDFTDSAGSFIDSLSLKKDFISFSLDHFRKGKSGGSVQVDCRIDLKGGGLSEPICIEKLQ